LETFSLHTVPSLQLNYYRWGNGEKILLCFHGFALDGTCFKNFETLKQHYTIYSFDLPYHGSSFWNSRQPIHPAVWHRVIQDWKKKHAVDRYELLGFSMGGKFALCVLDFDAAHIDQIILIAPDGVRKNFWYSLATHNRGSRYLFQKIAGEKSTFAQLATWMGKFKLLPEMTVKFAKSQMASADQRKKAYLIWSNFRLLYGSFPKRMKLILDYKIQVRLYTGVYDRVIEKKDVKDLAKLPSSLFYWKELNCGHTGILKELESEL
jgi:pimeloyl-ACP methyl ester carboxylesterase